MLCSIHSGPPFSFTRHRSGISAVTKYHNLGAIGSGVFRWGVSSVAKLNDRQRQFCREYIIDFNATQAAIRAGYSAKTAKSIGQRLLTNVDIQAEIQRLMAERSARTEITADRVLQELARLSFFDIRRLVYADGKPIPIEELDDDIAAAIVGLELVDYYEVNDAGKRVWAGYVKKYKLADKKGSLELVGRHLGMFDGGGKGISSEVTIIDDL